jgi:hypothetical protein
MPVPHTAPVLSDDAAAPVVGLSHWGSSSGRDETPPERLACN